MGRIKFVSRGTTVLAVIPQAHLTVNRLFVHGFPEALSVRTSPCSNTLVSLSLVRMKDWVVTVTSTGSRWSSWCEKSWSAGGQRTPPPSLPIPAWACRRDSTASPILEALGLPPRSPQTAWKAEEETAAPTSTCDTCVAVCHPAGEKVAVPGCHRIHYLYALAAIRCWSL